MPAPQDCELFIVDRDALFSYHRLAEALLQRIWALYTAAHYKNSPNDLQMLSDAPAHRLFVLLGPQKTGSSSSGGGGGGSLESQIPDVLCVVQVAFEGMINQKSVQVRITTLLLCYSLICSSLLRHCRPLLTPLPALIRSALFCAC
jgi:N-acetyltransferase 10